MSETPSIDFSVVIPTFARESYVRRLLETLAVARDHYSGGQVEVIIVDSSDGEAAGEIEEACACHHACYYHGEQSVRWKRNFGVRQSRYPIILFIDSDCEVAPSIFEEHAVVYSSGHDRLGGVYGLTEFVGPRSFLWRIIEYTAFVDVFSFAAKYPYVQWAIGNNISYYKTVFWEVGGFIEDFPFRLGGDDLDLSLRITTAGYWLKTNPNALTTHTRDTWNSWRAILDRASRWGRMEYFICQQHSQLLKRDLPRREPTFLFVTILIVLLTLITQDWLLLGGLLAWPILGFFARLAFDACAGQRRVFAFYALAQVPSGIYQWQSIREFFMHKRFDILFKRMIFSVYQIKGIWADETRRMWAMICALWLLLIILGLLARIH